VAETVEATCRGISREGGFGKPSHLNAFKLYPALNKKLFTDKNIIVCNFEKKTLMDKRLRSFEQLLDIMDTLREQCPWDSTQTIETLRHLTIEETYELADAILDNDMEEIKKELGDLMLHIVFYAKIGSENGSFDIADVLEGINKKLIRRHPHIYGDVKVNNEEDVKANWEHIKLKEGNRSVLAGVPHSLPALVKAYRIQEKARGVGFDWNNSHQVWEKVKEELVEFEQTIDNNESDARKEEEFGDLLFSLVNLSRFMNISPENALERCNKKFISRFNFLEKKASELSKPLNQMSLEEMDKLWEEAKNEC